MERTDSKSIFSYRLLIPSVIVAFCVLIVYAIHGIFPFGTESVVYDDMGQCNIPIFYTLWDALHGNGSIFFNFRTAAGIFMSNTFESGCSILNVLFFLICPRDKILESMSFFLLIKWMLTALFAMLLFEYRLSVHPMWKILFSVLYAFNPFMLQFYTNISWVEIVMLAPLVLLGADKLLRGGGSIPYIVSLFFILIIQLYISYMVILFLFLNGALYIFFLLPKEQQKIAAVRFGTSSVLAILLSAFSALPSYFYMTASSRYQNTKGYFQVLMSTAENPAQKTAMAILLTALPLAIVLLTMLRFKQEKRILTYVALSMLTFLLPVIFENINLLWHMGSYVNFPMRYAFLFHLMLLLCAGYGIQRFGDQFFRGKPIVAFIITVFCAGAAVFAWSEMQTFYGEQEKALISSANKSQIFVVFCILLAVYLILIRFSRRKIGCGLICALVLLESGFYVDHALTTGSQRSYEYSLDYIEECDNIYKTMPVEKSDLERIKNIDGTLNSNYPLIIDRASMSNFTHMIPSSIKSTMLRLGYSAVYTRILDTGGTLFTDALLGYKYALSLDKLPQKDYNYIGTAGRYMLYESRYAIPFGTVCSSDITEESIFEKYAFQTINNIWHSVSDKTDDLLEIPELLAHKGDHTSFIDLDVKGTKEVYLVCTGSQKRKNMQIYVNGRIVPIPTLGEPENTRYTTRFNNSLLDVGEFTDTHLSIRIELLNDTIKIENLQTRIALLDKALLRDYTESVRGTVKTENGKRSLQVSAHAASDDQILMLPVTYDSGWRCTVNGDRVQIRTAMGNFLGIPLEKGENTVKLTFLPKGFRIGLLISIVSILLFAAWLQADRKKLLYKLDEKPLGLVRNVYLVTVCGAYVFLYIIPMMCRIITFIRS